MNSHDVSSGGVMAPVTRPDTPADLGTHPARNTPAPTRVTTTNGRTPGMGTMRTPNANILRELPEHDREWAARGDRFAGSADERSYGAELLGRAIGHAAELMLPGLLPAPGTASPADVAAAADVGRWNAYAAVAAAMRPAVATFPPSQRLAVAAAACPVAGL